MKTLTTFLSLILLTTIATAETENKYLQCENKIYRDAEFVMGATSVVVRDLPKPYNNLKKALEEKLNLNHDSLTLQNVQIIANQALHAKHR